MDTPEDFLAREHAILGEDAAMFGNTFGSTTSANLPEDDMFLNGFSSPEEAFPPPLSAVKATVTPIYEVRN